MKSLMFTALGLYIMFFGVLLGLWLAPTPAEKIHIVPVEVVRFVETDRKASFEQIRKDYRIQGKLDCRVVQR